MMVVDGGELDVDGGRRGRHDAGGGGVHFAHRWIHAMDGVLLDGLQVVGGESETLKVGYRYRLFYFRGIIEMYIYFLFVPCRILWCTC